MISGSGLKEKAGGDGSEVLVGSGNGDNGRKRWRICLQGEETLFIFEAGALNLIEAKKKEEITLEAGEKGFKFNLMRFCLRGIDNSYLFLNDVGRTIS